MASRNTDRLEELIDHAAREAAKRERDVLGEHPSDMELIDYQEGRLAHKPSLRIRHHLALCQSCADDYLALESWNPEDSIDPMFLPSQEAITSRKAAFELLVASRDDLLPATGRTDIPPRSRTRDRWYPRILLAASTLLAVTGIAFWLWAGGMKSRPVLAGQNPFLFDLVPDNVENNRSAGGQRIAVPPGADLLAPRLNLEDLHRYPGYLVEVRDDGGALAWRQEGVRRQPAGSFLVLIPRSAMSSGSFLITVFALDADNKIVLGEYSVHVSYLPAP